MTLLASPNPRQQHVSSFLAGDRRSMALHAFQELVRVVIEYGMLKPPLRDIGFHDDWQRRAGRKLQRVALRARLPVQQFFRFRHAQRHPLLFREHAHRGWDWLMRKITVRSRHAQLGRVIGNILLKFLYQKRVNYFRRIVRRAFLETRIELQSVARGAVFRISHRRHIGTPRIHGRRKSVQIQIHRLILCLG